MAPWLGPVTVTVRQRTAERRRRRGRRHRHPATRRRPAAAAPCRRRWPRPRPATTPTRSTPCCAATGPTSWWPSSGRSGDRVLLVPALPRLGRACRGGVVHVDGVPVGGHDARRAAVVAAPGRAPRGCRRAATWSSSPTPPRCGRWLPDGGTFAVCDASSDEDLAAIAAVVAASRTASASPARRAASPPRSAATAPRVEPPCPPRWPATCSSCAAACTRRRGPRSTRSATGASPASPCSRSPLPDGPVVADRGRRAGGRRPRRRRPRPAGGATVRRARRSSAATRRRPCSGDEPMVAGGTLAPGVPWSRRADGSGPLVVTKAGGFGHRDDAGRPAGRPPPSEER